MKKILLFFLSLFPLLGIGQTTLQPGDVVILSFQGYGTGIATQDNFTFMPLVNLQAGTKINFTDVGWVSGAFASLEDGTSSIGDMITYTAPTAITAGTIIRQDYANIGGAAFTAYSGYARNYISSFNALDETTDRSGEQIFIFQGTKESPNFIWAIANKAWASSSINNSHSELPNILTAGVTAMVLPNLPGEDITADDAAYSGTTTAATKSEWQTRILNTSNWTLGAKTSSSYNYYPNGSSITTPSGSYTVISSNSAPSDISLSATSINENVAGNSTVGTLSSTDPDAGNTYTYTLVAGTGSTDNASFNISGGSLRITNSPNFEAKSSYSVRVRTTDQGSLSYEEAFTITINDVNETPTDIALSATSINENVAGNSTVGNLSTTDPDAGNTFTYTLVAGTGSTDNASFNISGGSLRITNSPNFEAKSSYSVRVRTTDQGSLWYEEAFTITINDVNETPTDIALSATSINENVAGNSTVGSLSSTDPDAGNTFTYTLVAGTGSTDNASFNISGANLRITNSPNFESKSSYSVRVRTTDQGSLWYEEAFTITINDVSEPPTVTTQAVSNIGSSNAIGNGNITIMGEPTPSQYGVVWGESANPTVDLSTKTTKGTPGATGAFNSLITGLSTNTTYHVRAYVTNSTGTAYGDDVTFTTTASMTEPGNALNFDGSNDYVVATDNDNSLTAFTIEAWVKWTPSATTDVQFICGKGFEQMEIHTGAGANDLRFIPTTGVYLDADNVLPTGVWTHVAVVYQPSSTTAKMYINGQEVSLTLSAGNIGTAISNTSIPFYIGRRDGAYPSNFKGSMDEVRVWNLVRTQAEIQADMDNSISASTSGLLNYYIFNEGTAGGSNTAGSTILPDLTSNGNNGTLTNFALTGSTSNWMESYAMVVPIATAASNITASGFTANWTAPATGTVNNYLLEVATDAAFINLVSGYDPKTIAAPTTNSLVTGLSSHTQYYYRLRADITSVTGQGAYSNSLSTVTLFPTTSTFNTDGNWSTAGNWSAGLPGATTNVTIDANCTLDGNYQANNFTINSNATFTISTGKTLIVNGNLILESDATGTASLINNGTLTVNGTTGIERYMTGSAWHMISSPISGQSISSFLGANALIALKPGTDIRGMKTYNETTNLWNELITNASPGNMGGGNGQAVWPSANGTVTFSGTLQSGAVTTSVVRNGTGWNCIGNPYSSAIAINTDAGAANFINLNSSNIDPSYGAIYVWEQSNNAYTMIRLSDAAYYAQSGQGFFVKAKVGGTQVAFSPTIQTHQTGVTLKSGTIPWPEIRLTASLGTSKSTTAIRFNESMTPGLDFGYDAGIFKSGFDLYTRLVEDNGVDFGIQCLPLTENKEMVIPIGLESAAEGTVTFATAITNLPSQCQVIFEDRQAGTFTTLGQDESTFTLPVTALSKITGRFFLHVSMAGTTGNGLSPKAEDWKIFAVKGQIHISGPDSGHATATIYDLMGREIRVTHLLKGSHHIIPSLEFKNGIYLLNIRQAGKSFTWKIPVQN